MYKIFIDTNIFLDFYRCNKNDSILALKPEFEKYQKFLINTMQSRDEFKRNRDKTIHDFIEILKKQINPVFDSNFLSTLDEYDNYIQNIKAANKSIEIMIEKSKELILNIDKDPVNNLYEIVCNTTYNRTDTIINKAIKRKYIGNPPVSNKYTCGDEIIWETILEYCTNDLIIVTRDSTFEENFAFLKEEYKLKTGKDLEIVNFISDAIRLLGNEPSLELEVAENSILVENKNLNDEFLQDRSYWVNIIYSALLFLGGEASLKDLYNKIQDIISKDYSNFFNNKNVEATIRATLQRYCSTSKFYNHKMDLFRNVKNGVWALNNKETKENLLESYN